MRTVSGIYLNYYYSESPSSIKVNVFIFWIFSSRQTPQLNYMYVSGFSFLDRSWDTDYIFSPSNMQ